MIDPNFFVRLKALHKDLEVCLRTSKWDRLGIDDLYIPTGVMRTLDRPIRKKTEKLIERLDVVLKNLESLAKDDPNIEQICENAWREYADVYNESQEIFKESMELAALS